MRPPGTAGSFVTRATDPAYSHAVTDPLPGRLRSQSACAGADGKRVFRS